MLSSCVDVLGRIPSLLIPVFLDELRCRKRESLHTLILEGLGHRLCEALDGQAPSRPSGRFVILSFG